MSILNALGLKAVGLKRRVPLLSFFTWFFGRSRVQMHMQSRAKNRPVHFLFLLSMLLVIMYASMRQFAPIIMFEGILFDISAPIVGGVQRVVISLSHVMDEFRSHSDLSKEIARLKEQNNNLLHVNTSMKKALFVQGEALKGVNLMKNLDEKKVFDGYVFQVETMNQPSFGQDLFVKVPSSSNTYIDLRLQKDFVVLGTKGLLGRVRHVGLHAARIQTIFDVTSRIPVDIKGVQAIAAGQGSAMLRLVYIKDAQHTLSVGDLVYTSGFGGIFPKGLPLGVIHRVENKTIDIAPFETGKALHIVNVAEHFPPSGE